MRRKFEQYASSNGFDWNSAHVWYCQSKRRLLTFKVLKIIILLCLFICTKGIYKAISFYRGSISSTLIDLFPTIKFDKFKFASPGTH